MDEERGSPPEPETGPGPAPASSLDETLPVVPATRPPSPGAAAERLAAAEQVTIAAERSESPQPSPEAPRDVRQDVPASAVPASSLDETLPVVGAAAARAVGETPEPRRPAAGGALDLLNATPEPARDRPPTSGSWRGDALAASPHARLAALLAPPRDDFDPGRAEALCAEVCRAVLGDFTPAVILLPPLERRRAQAVAAFALTLFDFARQRGADGDRLAQINRWEFTLEAALSGERIGQPVFLRMGEEERRRPFSHDGLDRLFAAARRRATVERPATAADAEAARRQFGEALALTLLGDGARPAALEFAAGLAGLRALLGLGAELAGGRCPLPVEALPVIRPRPSRDQLATAIEAEVHRLEPLLLRGARAVREVPLTFRRSTAYLVLAAERLLTRVGDAGPRLLDRPPHLGAFERLRLVVRARWGALARD